MSRFLTLTLSISALVGAANAQLISGPPGAAGVPVKVATPVPPPATPAPPAPTPVPGSGPEITTKQGAAAAAAVPNPNALVFDSENKEYQAKPGEESAAFAFNVTNISAKAVEINSLRTSCGCTVAQLPTEPGKPYTLQPGSNVAISVTVDLRGKMGAITKSVSVDTSAGFKSLIVRVNIPQPTNNTPAPAVAGAPNTAMGDRAKNIQSSLVDRQAVFKGDCAKCHVDKGVAKVGKELYDADCGICHEAEHRAAMVPDLKVPRTHRDLVFWQKWIVEGKSGTLMPAFAQPHGGPLTQEQIDSLAIYLYQTMPKDPPPGAQQAQAQPISVLPLPITPAPQKN